MYEEKTDEVILEDMLDNTRDDIDKREGSIAYDLLTPTAIELSLAYIELDAVLALGFADTSEGDWLERKTSELGVIRKPALIASGEVTFTGDEDTEIPTGTRVITENGLYFVTTDNVEIGESGEVTAPIEAEEGGSEYNVSAGDIVDIDGDLEDVIDVINEDDITGGIDEETDESLLERYYSRVRRPATSGNVYHYEEWAKEVPGVGDVKVYPTWDGAGTVKVVLLGGNQTAPEQSVIDDVESYIEDNRPVGANVTVVGAEEVSINISADLVLSSIADINDVKADIERGVTEYLGTLAFDDPLVRYTRIAAILLDIPRIIDYANLTVNGGEHNIEVSDGEVAVLGEVDVNDV